MNFSEAMQMYLAIRARYEQGEIDAAGLEEQVFNIKVSARDGGEWQITPFGGKWQRWNGKAWVEEDPPGDELALAHGREDQSGTIPYLGIPRLFWAGWVVLMLLAGGLAIALFTHSPVQEEPLPTAVSAGLPLAATETLYPSSPTPTAGETLPLLAATATPRPQIQPQSTPTRRLIGSPTITQRSLITRATFDPNDPTAAVRWRLVSQGEFDQESAVQDEWLNLIDVADEFTFGAYDDRDGMRLQFSLPFIDILSEDDETFDEFTDVILEETVAIPEEDGDMYFEFLCRAEDLASNYFLSLSREEWRLVRKIDADETELASGEPPAEFQNGGWGTVQLRCDDSQISAYFNGELIASGIDPLLTEGGWGTIFYLGETAITANFWMFNQRAWVRDPGEPIKIFDLAQTEEVFFQVIAEPEIDNDLISMEIVIDNHNEETLEIFASQVYLLEMDGDIINILPLSPSGSGEDALEFPLEVEPGRLAGQLFFEVEDGNIARDDLATVVIDLTEYDMAQIRIDLTEE